MLRTLLRKRKLPFLGEFTDAFFTTLPFFSIYSAISLTVILYTQTSTWLLVWLPWINLWIFMAITSCLFIIILFLTHKYIVPSLWASRSKQMSHLEQKLETIEKTIEKTLAIVEEKITKESPNGT